MPQVPAPAGGDAVAPLRMIEPVDVVPAGRRLDQAMRVTGEQQAVERRPGTNEHPRHERPVVPPQREVINHADPPQAERRDDLAAGIGIGADAQRNAVQPGGVEHRDGFPRQFDIAGGDVGDKSFQAGVADVHHLFPVGTVHVGFVGARLQGAEGGGGNGLQARVGGMELRLPG